MKIRKSIALVVLAAMAVSTALLSPASAGEPGSSLLAQGGGSYNRMGPGMMGQGMMSGGMMGQPAEPAAAPAATANPRRAATLQSYIQGHHLSCMQCHGIENNGFDPSFAEVSAAYEQRHGARALLAEHIANGFGRMPGGLASQAEAERLAAMIESLDKGKP